MGQWGTLVDSMRETPLEVVLERFGAQRDKKDKHNWRTSTGRITVTGSKFFNHDTGKGGGGAIDLVKHLGNLDFQSAMEFLTGRSGTVVSPKNRVSTDPVSQPKTFPPSPVPENWTVVREYLTQIRHIGKNLVDRLHEEGKIYADKYKNAVFLGDSGKGAELRGTGSKSFHGYRGEKEPFRIPGSGNRIMFVESAIDALSLRELGCAGTIVSFGGCAKGLAEQYGLQAVEKGLVVVAAFDNDKAGDAMAEALLTSVPSAERLVPETKDWNEDLLVRTKRSDMEVQGDILFRRSDLDIPTGNDR